MSTSSCIYLRVSRADQNPENQLADLKRMAESRGLEVVKVIEEKASGAKRARAGLAALMGGAHRGEYQHVLVWAVDRLGRSMLHTIEVVTELDRLGRKLLSHQEQWITTEGRTRGLLLAIFAWVAEQERARLIERTRAGLATARRNGSKLGRPSVTLDLPTVVALRRAGRSQREIARELGVSPSVVARALKAAE